MTGRCGWALVTIATTDVDGKRRAGKATVDSLTETITSLQAENERLRARLDETDAKQEAAQVTIEDLRKSIEKLQHENCTLRQRVSELEKENMCLRKKREAQDA